MTEHTIIVADDHPIVLDALKMIFKSKDNWKVVGEARDGIELLDMLKNTRPDIVIVDLEMPRMKGCETIAEIKRLYPEIHAIVLSGFVNEKNRQRAIQAGACAIISKGDSMHHLIHAIDKVINEGHGVSKKALVSDNGQLNKQNGETLTLREKQIMALLSEGKTSKEISNLLHISQWTVNKHRSNIMEKLGLKNVIELVRYAISNGYAFLPRIE
ncbi:MAG: response regulator transcription factor [Thermodesulfobacteriota bacterium]